MGCGQNERLLGNGPSTFRIQSALYHLIGSLLPLPNTASAFLQVYMYDGLPLNRLSVVGYTAIGIPRSHGRLQSSFMTLTLLLDSLHTMQSGYGWTTLSAYVSALRIQPQTINDGITFLSTRALLLSSLL